MPFSHQNEKIIYLDHAASTPLLPEALQVLGESFAQDFANPSANHRLGLDLQKRIEECRRYFLQSLGASESEGDFIFTSSATESNNAVIFSWAQSFGSLGKKVYYSSALHPSLLRPLEKNFSPEQLVKLPLGEKDLKEVVEFLRPFVTRQEVGGVILEQVNAQSGLIYAVEELSEALKEMDPRIFIHCDASQSFGKIPLRAGNFTSIALSAHKMGGPKGIAGLYWAHGQNMTPLLLGGGQEKGLRASTLAAPLIFSFHRGLIECLGQRPQWEEKVRGFKNFIRKVLREKLGENEVQFPFEKKNQQCSPYILMLLIPAIPSAILMRHLEEKNIFVACSSACSSRLLGENPSLTALKIPPKNHKFVLRLSFSPQQTQEEMLIFCQTLSEIYHQLKSLFGQH